MAAKHDDRTARGWPLPAHGNRLYDDVDRLIETLNIIDRSFSSVDTHEANIEERQDFLDTRMDVIAGQTTEDTEILDARVDAKREVHPNLGHNIRNIHASLVGVVDDFQGLLRQFNALAEAQIQGELNELEAHERRKKEIQLEALTRLMQDDGLQRQINEASTAILKTAHNLLDIKERLKTDSIYEENIRSTDDGILQVQIDELAIAIHENLLNLHNTLERRKKALEQEIQSRIENDTDLQMQVDRVSIAGLENSYAIHQEAEQRRESDERIDKTNEDHQAQIDKSIQAILENSTVLSEALSRRREALNQEKEARIKKDADLQIQSYKNSSAILQNVLNLHQEAEQRRKNLSDEEQTRFTEDVNLQGEIDVASEAILRNVLNIRQEAEKRRELSERLIQEVHDREREIQNLLTQIGTLYEIPLPGLDEKFSSLQSQTYKNAEANLENSLTIQSEAEQRRKSISEIKEALKDENLQHSHEQAQIDTLANAVLDTALNLQEGNSRRRTAISNEEQARIKNDTNLQVQVNELSTVGIENSLALHHEAEKRRKFDNQIETLESEAELSREQKKYQQTQLDFLVNAVMQSALNLRNEIEQRRRSKNAEALTLDENLLQAEIDETATAIIENALSIQKSNAKRRAEDTSERFTRVDQDEDLQSQINTLAETCMRIMLNNSETRAKISEVAKSVSGSTGVASNTEVDEMLDEIYNS